ncbi:hypothetical protein [Bradyrhizobium sp. BRP56]|uniref:hypothetical protein n=1 Tax=Bradyrhizobium sp. BRP56 TaxID=2793819 RepID=UPI001CD23577|nr:hypothetical protein [Bradyrhizobium sp. BRP56]MCA1398664.1 hypothetical protein [Bradyrhizobium sp. BRP56]
MLTQNASESTPVFVPPVFLSTSTTAKAPSAAARPKKFPEPSSALKKQKSFSDLFCAEYLRRAAALVRSIRKDRRHKHSASAVFDDVERAYRDFVAAKKRLAKLAKQLPANRTKPYPLVVLPREGRETSFASEVIRYFDDWTREARAQRRAWIEINCIKEQKIERLKTLKARTDALLEDQKLSGLYALRVETAARESALRSLTFEACCSVKLTSRLDCQKAAHLIRNLAKREVARPEYRIEINPYQIAALSKRLVTALANPSLR